jgi:hypothetical protein
MMYHSQQTDHASFQMLGVYEPESDCVKCNGTMPRKAEGGGFWCAEE